MRPRTEPHHRGVGICTIEANLTGDYAELRGGLVAQEQPLYAVFCTLRICHDPWGTAGHTATTAHHLYWIYNLVCISPI